MVYSIQEQNRRTGVFYHMNHLSVYLGRQRVSDRILHIIFNNKWWVSPSSPPPPPPPPPPPFLCLLKLAWDEGMGCRPAWTLGPAVSGMFPSCSVFVFHSWLFNLRRSSWCRLIGRKWTNPILLNFGINISCMTDGNSIQQNASILDVVAQRSTSRHVRWTCFCDSHCTISLEILRLIASKF